MEKGKVFKIHSDFYYVDYKSDVFECKLKEVLKKQKQNVLVGDDVFFEKINEINNQGVIYKVTNRKNELTRPKVANVNQAMLVVALKEPEINHTQINRFLCFFEYNKIKPIICFNKSDLCSAREIEKNVDIYKNIGYETIVTSVQQNSGFRDLKDKLKNKTTVLSGVSGVGKSSIVNLLNKKLTLKTNKISKKNERGTHTTRHLQMYNLDFEDAKESYIIDTPGFSYLSFDFIMPNELDRLFVEFNQYKKNCKFNNCTHVDEQFCNIIDNVGDNINISRYESYLCFLNEAKKYKEKITYNGNKIELNYKTNQQKTYVKISGKKRSQSRRVQNQSLKNKIEEENEI